MNKLIFDYSNAAIKKHEVHNFQEHVGLAHEMLHQKRGAGCDYLGWLDYPENYDKEEFNRILNVAQKIRQNTEILLVIGIGGSYLGARAAIEMLSHSFYNLLPANERKAPQIFFVGTNLSTTYYKHLMDIVSDKEFSICVVSKSGTTTEPAIAFRFFRTYLEKRYGKKKAADRIYVITDLCKGALRQLTNERGYESFVIPSDIGGRYSVLTPVGLLPMAVAGIDIVQVIEGAKVAYREYSVEDLNQNPCYQYAALRNILYQKGKDIEVLISYEPALQLFGEWWKQLFGESEGKDGKGIFPASMQFTTDLHSMGQLLQDGRRNLFETVLNVQKIKEDIFIPDDIENADGLNFINNKKLDWVNKNAFWGTMLAHTDGGVPALIVTIPEINPYYFGQTAYFFEKACAVSGYLLGVNPFDQPGVETYKKNMYALIGKPGYEELKEELEKRLKNNFL
jgi:glucose-6-phosphate isomerase